MCVSIHIPLVYDFPTKYRPPFIQENSIDFGSLYWLKYKSLAPSEDTADGSSDEAKVGKKNTPEFPYRSIGSE